MFCCCWGWCGGGSLWHHGGGAESDKDYGSVLVTGGSKGHKCPRPFPQGLSLSLMLCVSSVVPGRRMT